MLDEQLHELVIKQNDSQLKWINSMIDRFKAVTGKTLSRQEVVMRVLFYGYAGAENEMAAIEQGLWPIKGKKIKHLTVLD